MHGADWLCWTADTDPAVWSNYSPVLFFFCLKGEKAKNTVDWKTVSMGKEGIMHIYKPMMYTISAAHLKLWHCLHHLYVLYICIKSIRPVCNILHWSCQSPDLNSFQKCSSLSLLFQVNEYAFNSRQRQGLKTDFVALNHTTVSLVKFCCLSLVCIK